MEHRVPSRVYPHFPEIDFTYRHRRSVSGQTLDLRSQEYQLASHSRRPIEGGFAR